MAKPAKFSEAIIEKLKYYVYRLIDPRKGETFYVGKGFGNRVFSHVKDELGSSNDSLSNKIYRIREVRNAGFEVIHVIHRHGLDEKTAFQVEAALIDAYPEATNLVNGQGSDDFGLMHASQIIERYEAQEAVFYHDALLINIGQSAIQMSNYEAIRFAWKLNPKRARKAEVVLAIDRGLIIDVFQASKWLEATEENFPGISARWPDLTPGRWGFEGHQASEEIARLYRRCRLPDSMRRQGAANPIRYANKQEQSLLL